MAKKKNMNMEDYRYKKRGKWRLSLRFRSLKS